MFYLSKIAWAILQPSSFVAVLLAAGCLLLGFGYRRFGQRFLVGGAVLYAVFGFSPLANWLLIPLEARAGNHKQEEAAGAAGIIVLGGAIAEGSSLVGREPQTNEAGERMIEAVRLAQRYPSIPLVFTGGKAELIVSGDQTEAELARKFFAEFTITPPRLKLEDRSRNTLENALFTRELMKPTPDQIWMLVTSAYHMPRARAHFEAQGFRVLPWPVDFKTNGPSDRWRLFPQASKGLRLMDFAAKEWVGLYISWLRGDIRWP